MKRIKIEQHSSVGLFWFVGWLFTIGFRELGFWQGLFALIVWPYHIGTWVAGLPGVAG